MIRPDGGFRLPGERWKSAKRPGTRFPSLAPDFVIEVRSPDDRLGELRDKMQEYLDNGVRLGWLIEPLQRRVTIYRPGQEPKILNDPESIRGEGPVAGFELLLDRVFRACIEPSSQTTH